MSAQASDTTAPAAAKMTKGLAAVEQRNMATIKEKKISGNVAWLALTISYLEKLEREAAGEKPKKKSSKDMQDPIDADECHLQFKDGDTLGRSGKKYFNWKKGLLLELLHFCEPSVFPLHRKVVDSFTLMRQICEYGFGLNFCCSQNSDQTNNNGKLMTFQPLKQVHTQRGRLFKTLNFRDGMVDWCETGVLCAKTIIAGDTVSVIVVDRARNEEKQVPKELLPTNWSFTNKDIKCNFNFRDAHVVIPDEGPFFLHELFPRVRRTLERRSSAEVGACKVKNRGGLLGVIARNGPELRRGAKRGAGAPADASRDSKKQATGTATQGKTYGQEGASDGAKSMAAGANEGDGARKEQAPPSPPSTDAVSAAISIAKAVAEGGVARAKAVAAPGGQAGAKAKAAPKKNSEEESAGEDEEGDEEEAE